MPNWLEKDRPKLEKQGFAYLHGMSVCGTSKEERAELAEIAISRGLSMHDALIIFLRKRQSEK